MEKNKEDSSIPDQKLSICDVMKDDTSEIIKKMESQMPSIFQNYSELYTKYLHLFDNIFGTCYISEKQFFDKLNIDQGVLKQIKANSDSLKAYYLEHIEMSSKIFNEYTKMQISTIKSYDDYVHLMMNSYAKIMSMYAPKQD